MTIINKNRILRAGIVIFGSCWVIGYILADALKIQNMNMVEEFIFGVGILTSIVMIISFLSEFTKEK